MRGCGSTGTCVLASVVFMQWQNDDMAHLQPRCSLPACARTQPVTPSSTSSKLLQTMLALYGVASGCLATDPCDTAIVASLTEGKEGVLVPIAAIVHGRINVACLPGAAGCCMVHVPHASHKPVPSLVTSVHGGIAAPYYRTGWRSCRTSCCAAYFS